MPCSTRRYAKTKLPDDKLVSLSNGASGDVSQVRLFMRTDVYLHHEVPFPPSADVCRLPARFAHVSRRVRWRGWGIRRHSDGLNNPGY